MCLAHLNANIKPDCGFVNTPTAANFVSGELLKNAAVLEQPVLHSSNAQGYQGIKRLICGLIGFVLSTLVDSFHITGTALEHLAVCGAASAKYIQNHNLPAIMLLAFVCLSAG